ncbi:MAG: hypothetical protein AB7V13_06250 [Pseudorhodoplanes sp.]|uniref:hypothetical protein n=1 Tax=Pseudorhodoplanes sp. TaxID=1934341 RepID=UPI003D0CEF78
MDMRSGMRANRRDPNFRALTPFTRLPSNACTFSVENDASAPHLLKGEFAVVDTDDCELQHGELYVIQYMSGRREVVQARTDRTFWWVGDLRGYRQTGLISGIPVFEGLVDGPYEREHLQSKLVGRIIGFASMPLGAVLSSYRQ